MDQLTEQKLASMRRTLDTIENTKMSPMEGEDAIGSVIRPLFINDGYTFKKNIRMHSGEFDYIAEKQNTSEANTNTIAIEYKHYNRPLPLDAFGGFMVRASYSNMSRAIVIAKSKFTKTAREAATKFYPLKLELIDIDSLRSWIERIEVAPEIDDVEISEIRLAMSKGLIRLIANDKRNLKHIEWRELEHLLAEVFDGLGFDVTLTEGSKDGGKDIILKCRVASKNKIYFIEVKHWRSEQGVGTGIVTDFLNLIINQEVDGGLLLSTYGLCSSAIESLTTIQRQQLKFGTETKIASLCNSYLRSKSGLWTSAPDLSEVLFAETF